MSERIVIVGAGVIGCAIARELAPEYDVHVVEGDKIGSGATNRGAGEVTMTPSYTDYPTIAEHANEFFRSYDGTGNFWFEESESVELVSAENADEARRRAKRLSNDGLSVEFLEPTTLESRYERFNSREYSGAIRHAETGFTSPPTLVNTLANDARRRGATITTGTRVTGFQADNVVSGVTTENTVIDADYVIVAAGWQTGDLLADQLTLPVQPYRTQCAVFELDSPIPDTFPMGWVPGEHIYFRRTRDGKLLVGGWSQAVSEPATASRDSDPEFRQHIRDTVPDFLDGFRGATLADHWAGIDAATPDTRPIIDAPDALPNDLVIATGFHGRGIMTAPVAASVVRAIVADETAPVPSHPFSLERIDDRSSDFEFASISDGDH